MSTKDTAEIWRTPARAPVSRRPNAAAVVRIDLAFRDLPGDETGLVFGGQQMLFDPVDRVGKALVGVEAHQRQGVLAGEPDADAKHAADRHKHEERNRRRQCDRDRKPPVPSVPTKAPALVRIWVTWRLTLPDLKIETVPHPSLPRYGIALSPKRGKPVHLSVGQFSKNEIRPAAQNRRTHSGFSQGDRFSAARSRRKRW